MLIQISKKKPIFHLVKENEGFDEVLSQIGFKDIKNPIMLNTVGKFMTIEKGCSLRNTSIGDVKNQLLEYGYELVE